MSSTRHTIYTLGHSTRSADEFLGLLKQFGIEVLVDVRRYPTSRRHPHFVQAILQRSLAGAAITYVHEPDLGGRRTARRDSPNRAWERPGFRGYADHAATQPFGAALSRVMERAAAAPTAIMCAEAVPWRCHRQLIADYLVVRGWEVQHVMGPGQCTPHTLHPAAHP
ncbi:MAG: DUF488 family protein, partial [Gemmatimonadales bacterium]|nr:DUF488 family protein [Gemmatimonadales bacterium]NIN12028.1 DUF488 family protein [Gemmatimonadales bacterium]NIR03263.1 DUF488 family protein [Gemmatimonadales bacterium]NIS66943.1 DUF488 family protein [Gemmatimonadales bacterium]